MATSLKQRTISGIIWSAVQRFGTMIISFISNLILARLLSPDDFGYIGMLIVFIAISDSLVNSGFDQALIQKKQPTDEDYSTVFYFNFGFSIFLYILLFVFAPAISSFYKLEKLCSMLRVMGVVTIIYALTLVQNNQLYKKLRFDKLAIINLVSITIGTTVGIVMALIGFGVWSLVAKTLVNACARSLLCWLISKWKPIKVFSLSSFKGLLKFGGLIFLSDMAETIVSQLISLIIGKTYSSKKLGY